MRALKKIILESLALAVVAAAAGFAVNGVRASGAVNFARDYFPKVKAAPESTDAAVSADGQEGTHLSDTAEPPCDHPFRDISFDDAVAIFMDPNTAAGVNVFLDARSERLYAEGHIPGAIQADHYRLEECIDRTLGHVECAEKVVVYCNGGDCEDSLFLCTDLSEFDVPDNKLFLYKGGWEEWVEKGMPVAEGPVGGEEGR